MESSGKKRRSTPEARARGSSIRDRLTLGQAKLLLRVSKTMAAYESLDEMLRVLVEMATQELQAERGTIFLYDKDTNELYSRAAIGSFQREIRIMSHSGVAGHVFSERKGVIVHEAYADERFNRSVDEQTGFVTKSILCVPILTLKGEIVGVAQALNKREGQFTREDQVLLEALTTQAAIALQSTQVLEQMQKFRKQENDFYQIVSDITSEIDLGTLLNKVMLEATRMLNAERSTLFLNDERRGELFSKVGQGLDAAEIRFPNHLGIAGATFQSGESVKIPHAYADLRFNPAFDKQTGFFTRSILCVPVVNKLGKIIGVTQVLNKRGGPFTDEDESRLRAFTAQVSIALENAKLFDEIQNMKNYSESMLESMSNGVITLNEDRKIVTCNAAGLQTLKVTRTDVLDCSSAAFFAGPNAWVNERLQRVEEARRPDVAMDAELLFGGEIVSANLTILPLTSVEKKNLGTMIIIEDISAEKRLKSTMSRYMDPDVADRLLAKDQEILGGRGTMATVLFSDIRDFTSLTEELGPQGTVSLLNEYFTIMVDCIQREGGMLDKFIGDAIMAAFGVPLAHDDDEDRAVRAAVAMIRALTDWNRKRLSDGKKLVRIGIGLNTDTVVSGNIGSPKRMDYTLIGDGVNLASRLEGLCKQYHASILISEHTYKKLRGTYRAREIDRVVVKGKTETVDVYEVLDYHDETSFPNLMEVLSDFRYGLALYRKSQWEQAIRAFSAALQKNPDDTLCRIYLDRCQHFKNSPPGEGWNGVWVMTSK
jgi:adenylate cyclase